MRLSYIASMRDYIEKTGAKEITHKDIVRITNTNCPYSVIAGLKKYYDIEVEDVNKPVKVYDIAGRNYFRNIRYRKFKILGRK